MEFMDAGSLLDVLRLGDHRIPISVLKGVAKQVPLALFLILGCTRTSWCERELDTFPTKKRWAHKESDLYLRIGGFE